MPDVKFAVKPDDANWKKSATVTEQILARAKDSGGTIRQEWTKHCLLRVREMRDRLRNWLVGLEDKRGGHLLDWAMACLIARENLLLIGPPGVAKTEIAEQIFRMLGLDTPKVSDDADLPDVPTDPSLIREFWMAREAKERQSPKYFRYLLSRYTQPEELFGPIEINLLRRGMLVHVNFGLLTSPGVRGAFLDEIFKASSSILNALLTLVLEREYFNWGGLCRSDLAMLIGASNELPGGFAGGQSGVGSTGEDFTLLYAFLDRFPTRLYVPNVKGSSKPDPAQSDLARATRLALDREREKFTIPTPLDPYGWSFGGPSVNDTLLLGRAIMENKHALFDLEKLAAFETAFFNLAAQLQPQGTDSKGTLPTWTISPRKLKALHKIALAHALIVDDGFGQGGRSRVAGPSLDDLHVFDFIWDAEFARDTLQDRVGRAIRSGS